MTVPAGEFVAARSQVEETVHSIWTQLFDVASISRHDNFFDIGGHSLLATSLVAEIRRAFGVQLSLPEVFTASTISRLSEVILGSLQEAPPRTSVNIQRIPRDSTGVYAASLNQEAKFRQYAGSAGPGSRRLIRNAPCVLRLEGPLEPAKIEESVNILLRRHEILRSTFAVIDQNVKLVLPPAASVSLVQTDLTHLDSDRAARVARRIVREDLEGPFDYRTPPLVRARLIALREDEHILALIVDHLLVDRWSFDVLTAEITSAYESYVCGDEPALPSAGVEFVDYVDWQRRHLGDARLAELERYWRRKFPNPRDLRVEFPLARRVTATIPAARGGTETLILPETFGAVIRRVTRHAECPSIAVLLASVAVVVHSFTGTRIVPVFSSVADRELPELQRLVGPLHARLCYRIELGDDPTVGALLERVRAEVYEALEHKDLPFPRFDRILRESAQLPPQSEFPQLLVDIADGSLKPRKAGPVTFSPYQDIEVTQAGPGLSLWLLFAEGEESRLRAVYREDRYSRSNVAHVLQAIAAIVEAIELDSSQRISDLRRALRSNQTSSRY